MKRTDLMTKLLSVLLFAVLVLYVGTYLLSSFGDNLRTAPVIEVSISDSTPASGIVVRGETLIQNDEPHLSIHAEEGRMLSCGSVIALAYNGQDALQRAAQIKELERKKHYITAVLARNEYSDDLSDRESMISEAITDISSASARHETERLSDASITLETLVFEKNFSSATQADLDAVNADLNSMQQNAILDKKAIRTETAGLFTSATDGYEYLTPDTVSAFCPDDLRNAESAPNDIPDDVIGKIVNPYEWYFASVLYKKDAEKLEVGTYSTLDFGRYSSQLLKAKVMSISPPLNDEQVVVFRCTTDVSDMLSVRRVNAEIVYNTHSGLRIQKDAVYPKSETPEASQTVDLPVEGTDNANDSVDPYVYTLTGVRAEKKYVNILWKTDDYYLAEPAEEGPLLREGNDIILSDKEPEDGQLMREG